MCQHIAGLLLLSPYSVMYLCVCECMYVPPYGPTVPFVVGLDPVYTYVCTCIYIYAIYTYTFIQTCRDPEGTQNRSGLMCIHIYRHVYIQSHSHLFSSRGHRDRSARWRAISACAASRRRTPYRLILTHSRIVQRNHGIIVVVIIAVILVRILTRRHFAVV
jgi:hypothetical protein